MMPLVDLFQDVNTVPARSVYPTMTGGTTAGAGAAMNATTNVATADPLTGNAQQTVGTVPSGSKHSIAWWVGFLGLLIAMVWIARKAGGEEDFRNIRPTAYNFLTIVLTSIVGIVGLKVIFTKFKVPGASDIILAA